VAAAKNLTVRLQKFNKEGGDPGTPGQDDAVAENERI